MAIEVKNALGWGSDIQAEAPASSVGALVWPPREASEQRKKGVLSRVLETGEDLVGAGAEFGRLDYGHTKDGEDITRISGRIFASRGALASISPSERALLGQYVEGVIPLQGTGVEGLEDVVLVYLGKNAQARRSAPGAVDEEIALARQTFAQTREVSSRVYADYDFRLLSPEDRSDANLQREYADLYAAFGWSEGDVVSMLTNPSNTLMAAFHSKPGEQRGSLASAVIAEKACLPITRAGAIFPLELAEITEAITTPEHRGNGLYTELAIRLMGVLAGSDVNLVYGESNALRVADRTGQIRQPVLSSVAKLGRQSVIGPMEEFGFTPRLLEQHVRISMGEGDRRPPHAKNDLLVTFMPKAALIARYGKQS